jgi:succinate dehydrogenase/fumarate reductase flavoprotein subunit
MEPETLRWQGLELPVVTLDAAVVGSGAAGFSAACWLDDLGVGNIALLTEGVNFGTSRNTGSDKQTYYKLSLCGDSPDSVQAMAETLFSGGSMDGDIALAEAASSVRSFIRLANLGVPFPHNEFGEYAGYKTDHDPRQRATSAGPLTSKYMTEALEGEARRREIPILDGFLVIGILVNELDIRQCCGLLALDCSKTQEPTRGLTLFRTANVVWATGGAAGMFHSSVYPMSQHGTLGVTLEAGAAASNLQEWQHGLASVKFRWNVSGTYQQVLPRYISTDGDGNHPEEFLLQYMTPQNALELTFLKGYQWPFDARKIPGSSLIDIYTYIETNNKGRRVWLDYRANPTGLENGFDGLSGECHTYLEKSGALFGTPYERLKKMNPDAIELYRAHGIDLETEMLEVAVCAQHMNGGLAVDSWWRTSIGGLYACGEAAGTFGAYRPGGSALNSTQTGSLRAAQHIAANRRGFVPDTSDFEQAARLLLDHKGLHALQTPIAGAENLQPLLAHARSRMSRCGAHLRNKTKLETALAECRRDIAGYWAGLRLASPSALPRAYRGWDMLVSQYACLSAMLAYIDLGGPSRGSALILDENGIELPGVLWKYKPYGSGMDASILKTGLKMQNNTPQCESTLRPVRPIPNRDLWFERVWEQYRAGDVYGRDTNGHQDV